MDLVSIIESRRNGRGNTGPELDFIARGAASGQIPDYQLSAWLMAEFFNPLSLEETAQLVTAMAETGERVNLEGLPHPWVDKHSTGGVGDKTTLVLLPMLAACGLTIVKMSGRGLGITGGTADKLASIPGFRMDLTPEELKAQARKIGVAITGQSPSLAPADHVLYRIRDVTATVDSIPLIVSSILSKKLAGGAEMVVLDVKCGSGAFMTDLKKAQQLGQALKETGDKVGLPTYISITEMDQPLGRTVGNLLEVQEAVSVLQGEQGRFTDLCVELAAHTLLVTNKASTQEEAKQEARGILQSKAALNKAKEWFAAQGATVDVFGELKSVLSQAPVQLVVKNPHGSGCVQRVNARMVGEVVIDLGGGRRVKSDAIDPTVGVEVLKHVGSEVEANDPLFVVHAASAASAEQAAENLANAAEVGKREVPPPPLILGMY